MTILEVVQEIAAEYGARPTEEQAHMILWTFTGFPSFWNIPDDGATPEACMRKQLRTYFADPKGTADRWEESMARACVALREEDDAS